MYITSALKKYGFTENEALIYKYLLEHIDVTAFTISRDINIPKTTVYNTLQDMVHQGFVSSWKKNNVSYFTAESPNQLKRLLEEKKALIDDILPDLHALSDKHNVTPTIKLYSGKVGLKTAFEGILETLKREHVRRRYVAFHPDVLTYFPKYLASWTKRKEELGVYSYLIVPESLREKTDVPIVYKSNELRETRYLPDKFFSKGSIDINGSQIDFFAVREGELHAVVIKSSAIADMFSHLFLYVWETLAKES